MDGIHQTLAENFLGVFLGNAIDPALLGTAGQVFVGLSTTEPLADGTGFTEPDAGTGYARQPLTIGTNAFSTPANRGVKVLPPLFYPDVTGTPWAQAVAVGLFKASTGGAPFIFGGLDTGRIIPVGDAAYFPGSSIELYNAKEGLQGKGLAWANAQYNVLRGISPSILTNVYIALGTGPITVSNDVVNIGELAANTGYERLKVATTSTNWGVTSARTLKNLVELKFVKEANLPSLISIADVDLPEIKTFAIYSTLAGTDPMYYGKLEKNAVVYEKDILRIGINKLVITE